jgi:hypothetical protein
MIDGNVLINVSAPGPYAAATPACCVFQSDLGDEI